MLMGLSLTTAGFTATHIGSSATPARKAVETPAAENTTPAAPQQPSGYWRRTGGLNISI